MHQPTTTVVVDRRTRPTFVERRDDPNPAPRRGLDGTKIARGQAGRRETDPRAKVWPVATSWSQQQTFVPDTSTSYRMPSGQLIRID